MNDPAISKPSSDTRFQRLSRFARHSPFLSSLRTRLLTLVLIAVLPALGLIIYNTVERRQQAAAEAEQAAMRVVRQAARQHDQLIEGTRVLLSILAQLREVQNTNGPECEEIFRNLISFHGSYVNIGACDPLGYVFASAVPWTNGVSAADRSWFRQATNTLQFSIGDYQVGRITRKASLNMGFPVLDESAQLRAVVFAALDLSWLNAMVTNLDLPPNSSMTVMDRNRVTLVRHPDASFVGQEVPRRPGSTNRAWREGVGVWRSRDGTRRLGAYTRLGGKMEAEPPRISVGIPVDTAYATANRMLVMNLAFLGIVSGFALAAAWYGGNIIILRRVKALVAATDRLNAGDLQTRTGLEYGKGELGQLARAFDEMVASLEQKVAQRDQAEANLRALTQDLEARVASRTNELRRSNEDLDQFAAVASHDLQEPLRMVTNYLQLLEQRYAAQLDPKAREFIGFAMDGATRMQQLIRDLLTYSRVSTKTQPFEPTDAGQALQRAVANLKLAIEESGATVTHGTLPVISGDASLITQLFQNLISNALKFRGTEPPRIRIDVERAGHEWVFSVRDNGIGVAPADFERIFIIFQRLHSREKYPGTGIGLSVCKKIVERHGGRIWLESQPGQGTTFYFTLPVGPG